MSETQFDAKRRLCPDGACIGVIGPTGRCSECGRDATGKPDMSLVDENAAEASDVEGSAEAGAAVTGGFDPKRRLCDDDTCVGVIGPDSRCGVCGRQAGG